MPNMAWATNYTKMAIAIRANTLTTKDRDSVFISGKMERFMRESGL